MKEPFVKIIKEEKYDTVLAVGVIQGLTIGMPQILGYSEKLNHQGISNNWKKEIAEEFSLKGLSNMELEKSSSEQISSLEKYSSIHNDEPISVIVLDDVIEESDGILIEKTENYTFKRLVSDKSTAEAYIVVT